MSRLPKQCTGRFRCLKKGSTTSKNGYLGLQTKQSKKTTCEKSLPGRTRNWLERSIGNAKDEDVLRMPFLTGARASYSLLAQDASFHSGFTALRSYIKVSTKSFFQHLTKHRIHFYFKTAMVAFFCSSPAVFTEFYFTLKFSHIETHTGLRRNKPLYQTFQKTTLTPP